jgi:hypothetical protein
MRRVSPSPMGIKHKNGFFHTWEGDQLGYRPVLHTHTHRRAHAHILCLSLINLRQVPTSYSSVIFLRLNVWTGHVDLKSSAPSKKSPSCFNPSETRKMMPFGFGSLHRLISLCASARPHAIFFVRGRSCCGTSYSPVKLR